MKKIILYFILIISCKTAFSQANDKYLELIIEDSIKIDPEIIDYTLIIQPSNDYTFTVDTTSGVTQSTTTDRMHLDEMNMREKESVGGWTAYPPLSAMMESSQSIFNDQIILQKKITIRYSWQ